MTQKRLIERSDGVLGGPPALAAANHRFQVLRPLLPRVQDMLQTVQPGDVIRITG